MKADQSEKILVEELIAKSILKLGIDEKIVKISKLTGDASTRRYYRAYTDKKSYVVCLDNPIEDISKETTFVKLQTVLHREGVRVPLILDKDLLKGYMLQEDLGDETFLKDIASIQSKEEEYAYYKTAIDLMIKIHQIKVENYKGEDFTNMAFDKTKLFQEMEFTKKYFLDRYLGIDVTSDDVKAIYTRLEDMCQMLSDEPRVLVHRDYHSRNIMMLNKEQIVIDFQDARMGTPLYDLVSVLEDCYYQLDLDNKEKLIQYYFESTFSKFDNKKSFEEFKVLYDMMAIQRVFKAIGSFAYIYADRKDLRYVKYIGYAFEKVRCLMSKYESFSEARINLARLYYAN